MCITVVSAPAGKAGRSVEERRDYERFASKYNFGINTSTEKTAANSMFARLGTDYEIRNQWFFAILEAMTRLRPFTVEVL